MNSQISNDLLQPQYEKPCENIYGSIKRYQCWVIGIDFRGLRVVEPIVTRQTMASAARLFFAARDAPQHYGIDSFVEPTRVSVLHVVVFIEESEIESLL